jgi:beta-glucosidase-like glycosyl hydrolase
MGVAFVLGMQGSDPRYLKVVATPKHYAVYSGPEPERHTFDAKVSEADMIDTYLPAFRATVVEGKAESVMCVYNAVNGIPGCASSDLLQKRLREGWGFKGYVVSGCGAVNDTYLNHKFAPTMGGAAVSAVKAGTDPTCGTEYKTLVDEVKAGAISEAEIDRALARLFVAEDAVAVVPHPTSWWWQKRGEIEKYVTNVAVSLSAALLGGGTWGAMAVMGTTATASSRRRCRSTPCWCSRRRGGRHSAARCTSTTLRSATGWRLASGAWLEDFGGRARLRPGQVP